MGASHTRHWQLGDVKITRVYEMKDQIDSSMLLTEATPELVKKYDWLVPNFATADGQLILWFQAFIVAAGDRRIMIDTCIGNGRVREIPVCNNLQTSFLEDMRAAGYPPDSIDTVLCTHLHFDHVGWNTHQVNGRWVPTFPKARYLFARREWEHSKELLRDGTPAQVAHLKDSVVPILDAGLADFVECDHRVTDEVWLEPSPGHTPGHVCVHIASRGQHAIVTGDAFHNPIQFAEPDMQTPFCADAKLACRTRRELLSRYENKQALVFGSHFCDPTAGYIIRDARNWRFSAD